MAEKTEIREATELERAHDLLELAWGVIANVGGHPKNDGWPSQGKDWQEAAVRWRDDYHALLRVRSEAERT